MFTLRNISTFLLLAGPSLAAPLNVLLDPNQQGSVAKRAVSQGAGYVSNGILYLTTTIVVTVTAGETPSPAVASTPAAAPPAASTPALAAPSSPVASAASAAASPPPPAAPAPPSMQHTTMATSASPAPTTSAAPTSKAAPAPVPAVSSTQALAAAAPASSSSSSSSSTSGSTLDAAMLLQVMPDSASCSSANSECRTAAQAVPFLTAGFAKWGINSKAAQAANIALIALESGEMQFDTAQTPPTPGKGTRNMMSPTFVQKYATALYPDKIASAGGDPVKILDLVNDDTDSFASASWFLATVCPDVLKQFATDPAGAWTAYLGPNCISTTDTAARDAYWTKAKAALGV